jgi:hypothetical protein
MVSRTYKKKIIIKDYLFKQGYSILAVRILPGYVQFWEFGGVVKNFRKI